MHLFADDDAQRRRAEESVIVDVPPGALEEGVRAAASPQKLAVVAPVTIAAAAGPWKPEASENSSRVRRPRTRRLQGDITRSATF
jgi:hypothetical protein